MIQIPLTQKIVDYSSKLVKENNFGQRGYDDGNYKEQLVGIISENTVRRYLGCELIKPDGFDGGYDIMYKNFYTDIKSMTRNVEPKDFYINNLFDAQLEHKAEAFIFTSLNVKNKILSVCGWITKKEFKEKAIFYPKGTQRIRGVEKFTLRADNWEISNSQLKKFEQQ
jgi:hypothetical protein